MQNLKILNDKIEQSFVKVSGALPGIYDDFIYFLLYLARKCIIYVKCTPEGVLKEPLTIIIRYSVAAR